MKHPELLLCASDVFVMPRCANKDIFLSTIAALFETRTEIPATTILAALHEREALDSTALGQGVALPHGRIKGLKHAHALFIRLDEPLDYDALDGQGIDLVLALIFPPQDVQRHLEVLSLAAQIFADESVCTILRTAKTPAEIYAPLLPRLN